MPRKKSERSWWEFQLTNRDDRPKNWIAPTGRGIQTGRVTGGDPGKSRIKGNTISPYPSSPVISPKEIPEATVETIADCKRGQHKLNYIRSTTYEGLPLNCRAQWCMVCGGLLGENGLFYFPGVAKAVFNKSDLDGD